MKNQLNLEFGSDNQIFYISVIGESNVEVYTAKNTAEKTISAQFFFFLSNDLLDCVFVCFSAAWQNQIDTAVFFCWRCAFSFFNGVSSIVFCVVCVVAAANAVVAAAVFLDP